MCRIAHGGLAVLLIGCVVPEPVPSPTISAHAAPAAPTPEVRKRTALVRRAAPHGKAHVTELAHGAEAWLGILELAPDVAVPEHQDPTEETIHVLSGGGTITIDGTAYEVTGGDTIFMPANATVSYRNGPTPLRAVQVFAGPEPASKYDGWKAE